MQSQSSYQAYDGVDEVFHHGLSLVEVEMKETRYVPLALPTVALKLKPSHVSHQIYPAHHSKPAITKFIRQLRVSFAKFIIDISNFHWR